VRTDSSSFFFVGSFSLGNSFGRGWLLSQVPGLGLGVALFGVYMIAETAMSAAGGSKDKKGHH